jgi:hypothetical protein
MRDMERACSTAFTARGYIEEDTADNWDLHELPIETEIYYKVITPRSTIAAALILSNRKSSTTSVTRSSSSAKRHTHCQNFDTVLDLSPAFAGVVAAAPLAPAEELSLVPAPVVVVIGKTWAVHG